MEILHKAKRKDTGEWVEGYYIKTEESSYILAEIILGEFKEKFQVWVEVDPETVCVYTGKNDEKGNEIWSHDYVAFVDKYYAQANNLGYTAMRATGSTDKEGNPTYATLGYCGNLKEVLVIVLRDAVQNHVKGSEMELRDALDFVEEQTDRIMKALEGVEV